MSTPWSDAEIDAAVLTALEENHLHKAFRGMVRRYVTDGTEVWRDCCESDCDPCVVELIPVVDRAREILGGAGGEE